MPAVPEILVSRIRFMDAADGAAAVAALFTAFPASLKTDYSGMICALECLVRQGVLNHGTVDLTLAVSQVDYYRFLPDNKPLAAIASAITAVTPDNQVQVMPGPFGLTVKLRPLFTRIGNTDRVQLLVTPYCAVIGGQVIWQKCD